MRIGPRNVVCCRGIHGLVCWADFVNHQLPWQNRQVCNWHEHIITGGEYGCLPWRREERTGADL